MRCHGISLKAKKKLQCDKNYLSYNKILLQICESKQQDSELRNENTKTSIEISNNTAVRLTSDYINSMLTPQKTKALKIYLDHYIKCKLTFSLPTARPIRLMHSIVFPRKSLNSF